MAAGDYFIITVLRHGDVVAAGVLDLVHHLVGLADDFVRAFGDYLTAAVVMAKPVLAGSQGANDMYGLIVKLTAVPGKRDEVTRILRESAGVMPECLSYVVAKDSAE